MTVRVADEDLMDQFRDRNDFAAYDELYRRYRPRIYAHQLAMTRNNATTADDLTQETFCRVIDKKHLFDRSRGTFSVWLYRLATNLNYDFARQLKHTATVALETIVERFVESSPIPLEILVTECLDELTSLDRKIILLTVIEGFTDVEVSRILDMPPGTIGRRRYMAFRKLRTMLGTRPAMTPTQF